MYSKTEAVSVLDGPARAELLLQKRMLEDRANMTIGRRGQSYSFKRGCWRTERIATIDVYLPSLGIFTSKYTNIDCMLFS